MFNMMKEIIQKQKKEREEMAKLPYIPREASFEAEKFINQDLVKVITGPRRAGKSFFALHLLANQKFAYVNFDHEYFLKINDYDLILKELFSVYGDFKILFFDEIQNLPGWELFVNRLQRGGYNLVITGSNAKLLSKELATSLTGRHIPIEIFPFSFKEFLSAKNFSFKNEEIILPEIQGKILNYLNLFLETGGFPEIAVKGVEPSIYLNTLMDALLFKDVVKRYKLRFAQKISDIETYLIANASSEFSYRKIAKSLEFNSIATLEKYIGYLEEAYLIYVLTRYSHKTKEILKSPKKAYLVDNGYISAKTMRSYSNNGRLLENFIFSELLKKGYKPNENLFYYKTRNQKEIDFVVKKGYSIEKLVQVAYKVDGISAFEREIKALAETSEELKCENLFVFTWDYKDEKEFKGHKIKFIPAWEWALEKLPAS